MVGILAIKTLWETIPIVISILIFFDLATFAEKTF